MEQYPYWLYFGAQPYQGAQSMYPYYGAQSAYEPGAGGAGASGQTILYADGKPVVTFSEEYLKKEAERLNQEKMERMQKQIEELELQIEQQKQNRDLIEALKSEPQWTHTDWEPDPKEELDKETTTISLIDAFLAVIVMLTFWFVFCVFGGFKSLMNICISIFWLIIALVEWNDHRKSKK